MKLDATDMRLLYYLSINARLSYSTLASNLGISREAVKGRMGRLERDKVITSYQAVYNHPKFGLNFYNVYFNFSRMDSSKEKKLEKYISNHKSVIWTDKCLGKWTYALLLLAKNSQDFADTLDDFKEKFKGMLKDLEFEEVLYEYKYSTSVKAFFRGTEIKPLKITKEGSSFYSLMENEYVFAPRNFEKQKIDRIDVGIMKLVGKNARITLNEMSEKLGLPVENVRYRMKRLVEKTLIGGFWAGINYTMFGFQWNRILMRTNRIKDEEEEKLRKFILNSENIFWGARTLGRTDLHIDILVKGHGELNEFLEKFNSEFSDLLIDYETIIVNGTPTYNNFAEKFYEVAG